MIIKLDISMKNLKEALMKIGLKSTKSENERPKIAHKKLKVSEKHQSIRNFCEVCHLHQPDVEFYKHRNPTVNAEWICCSCVDKNFIDDKFRTTEQSDFSKKRIFRREYGATKKFPR